MRTALFSFAALVAFVGLALAQPKKRDPISIVFVLDTSGSMMGPKLESARNGMLDAIAGLAETDKVAVVTFDSTATVLVPVEDARANAARDKKIRDIKPGGGTNILPGLEAAWNQLAGVKSTKKKHVVLLCDGEAPSDGLEELLKKMSADGVTVSTIALVGADEALLQLIASRGAGRFHKLDPANSLGKVMVKEVQTAAGGVK
ncbi:MAG: VWA domain-containing protein [Deltaproteobacteria bacterium]|nr:VWA domain-containing protein [Deltaproteobacteria bacterium]